MRAITKAIKTQTSGGLLHITIDNVPMVISSLGGKESEEIIYNLMETIKATLNKGDKLIRRNRETFKILLNDYTPARLKTKANEIHQTIISYGITSETPVQLIATIGSATFPKASDNADEIINRAYIALNDAKEEGIHYLEYKNAAKHETESKNQMVLASYLQNAFIKNRLHLAYQPIVNTKTGNVEYYEGLLRIKGEKGKISSAGPFIPIAEKMGFIDVIDIMVLQMVVDELKQNPELTLSVNVSNASMTSPKWLETVTKLLKDDKIASRLIVEIIETSEQQNLKKVVHFITKLQNLGCRVALDDFGTGYTSFSQLKNLPVDIIKIDGSFIRDIATNEKNKFFVKTLLEFSKNFGLKTVAEYVEDKKTVDILKKMKVDYLQGNYFSPALSADKMREDN